MPPAAIVSRHPVSPFFQFKRAKARKIDIRPERDHLEFPTLLGSECCSIITVTIARCRSTFKPCSKQRHVSVIDDEDVGGALDAGWGPHPIFRNGKSGFRRCAGLCFFLFQVLQDLRNHFVIGNEGDDAIGTAAITLQRID